jgi:acyl carrier protein
MSDVIADIRRFLSTQLRVADADTVAPDFALVKRGVLDSIELMQVVGFLESTYGIKVDDTEIVPENLGSLASMEALVARKKQAGS